MSGVINLNLKRNFDGAVSQLGWTTSDGGKNHFLASQMWGRTWDGGQVTLSYEWYDDAPLSGKVHSKYTLDFSPWGLDDRRPIASSAPGTISVGSAAQPAFGNPGTSAASNTRPRTACRPPTMLWAHTPCPPTILIIRPTHRPICESIIVSRWNIPPTPPFMNWRRVISSACISACRLAGTPTSFTPSPPTPTSSTSPAR